MNCKKYRTNRLTFFLIFIASVFSSCNQKKIVKDELVTPNLKDIDTNAEKGNADYSKYVAIGDSYSAGYMDGALYTSGQNNSIPIILSKSFKLVGGGEFNQPNINTDVGFSTTLTYATEGVLGRTRFVYKNGKPTIEATPKGVIPTNYIGDKSALNNISVPFLRTINIDTKGSDLANPYLSRILSNATDTYFNRIQQSKHNTTFYSVWLGIIDIALWAIEGGEGEDAAKYQTQEERQKLYSKTNVLVDTRDFKASYIRILGSIFTAPNIKGFVVNIPDFTKIPYFSEVKYNIIAVDEDFNKILNEYFTPYNTLIDKIESVKSSLSFIDQSISNLLIRKIQFNVNNNAILIKDKSLIKLSTIVDTVIRGLASGDSSINELIALKAKIGLLEQVRHANSSDIILLSAAKLIGVPSKESTDLIPGITTPLDTKYVISGTELELLQNRITQFNQAIEEAVSETKLKDQVIIINSNNILNSFIAKKSNLLSFDPLDGIFSTDGTHLNPRGQAILADSILHSLEKKFGGNFPEIDISSFRGNEFPTLE